METKKKTTNWFKGHPRGPIRNVILMISDGFGPASQTAARNYHQYVSNSPVNTQLPLDTILVGSSRTRSSSSLVTDSAAGATAFACALKSYNGAIGVDSAGVPCGTVLEAAKAVGMLTGLVATSRITHATPASFSAHVLQRDSENDIALHQIGNYTLGRQVDLMFGGGLCHFLPNSSVGSCRADSINVLQEATQKGFNAGVGRPFFDGIGPDSPLPILNLFTYDHMSYDIDRNATVEPSLKEMAVKALGVLQESTRGSRKGFFLMIEGSRIDMAGHSNDPKTHIGDILAYNDAIDAVQQFVAQHPGTVMVSVSDHETGGLSAAKQFGSLYPIYAWYPEALVNVTHSGEFISRQIKAYPDRDLRHFVVETVFKQWLGQTDPSDQDVQFLSDATKSAADIDLYLGTMVSSWAQIGWSTHGHSAVDVNLYAYGTNADELAGNHENTEIGDFIVKNLGLDLDAITRKLATHSPDAVQNGKVPNNTHFHHNY